MSKGIDFIETNLLNFHNIIRPPLKADLRNDKKTTSIPSIVIKPSFKPELKSTINEALRPEIEKLK